MNKQFAFRIFSAGFALSALAASPAFAHATLTGTSPAADSSATDVTAISLSANEDLLNLNGDGTGFVITVSDPEGHFYGDGCVAVDGVTASMPVQLGAGGLYSVAYRVVSADGHPIEGSWTFTYAPAPDAVAGQAYLDAPVCGQEATPVEAAQETAPTEMPTPMAVTAVDDDSDNEGSGDFDIVPFIGIATIPVLAGAIWLLTRLLGKRESEDHLN